MGSIVLHFKVQMKLGKPVPGNWKSLEIGISLSGNSYLSSKKLEIQCDLPGSLTCLEDILFFSHFGM
jgi:hypothetical protein